jgi:hypothetical protein
VPRHAGHTSPPFRTHGVSRPITELIFSPLCLQLPEHVHTNNTLHAALLLLCCCYSCHLPYLFFRAGGSPQGFLFVCLFLLAHEAGEETHRFVDMATSQEHRHRQPLYITTALHCNLLSVGCPCPMVSQQGIEGRALRFASIRRRIPSPSSSSDRERGSCGVTESEGVAKRSASLARTESLAVLVEPPTDLEQRFLFPGVLERWGLGVNDRDTGDTQHAASTSSPSTSDCISSGQSVAAPAASILGGGFCTASMLFEQKFGVSEAASHRKRQRDSLS